MTDAPSIRIAQLRQLTQMLLDSCEAWGGEEWVLDEDLYWEVDECVRYDFSRTPDGKDFTAGQLYDDWHFLTPLLDNPEEAHPVMLLHLAPLLRYMALNIPHQNTRGQGGRD